MEVTLKDRWYAEFHGVFYLLKWLNQANVWVHNGKEDIMLHFPSFHSVNIASLQVTTPIQIAMNES